MYELLKLDSITLRSVYSPLLHTFFIIFRFFEILILILNYSEELDFKMQSVFPTDNCVCLVKNNGKIM